MLIYTIGTLKYYHRYDAVRMNIASKWHKPETFLAIFLPKWIFQGVSLSVRAMKGLRSKPKGLTEIVFPSYL